MDTAAAPVTPAAPVAADPVDPAAVVAEAAKGTPAPKPAAPSADDVAKQRLDAIAAEKEDLRKKEEGLKERLTKAEKQEKFDELRGKGDYIGALEAIGVDPDDFYLKATDAINAREKAKKDPEAVAKKLIEDHETKKQQEAREASEKTWTTAAHAELEKARDTYPDVVMAIAAGKFSMADVIKVGYAEAANGRDSSAPVVLKLIQDKIKPPATAAAPATGDKPSASAGGAPVAAPGSSVPVVKPDGGKDEDLSVDEAFERAKAKHFKR